MTTPGPNAAVQKAIFAALTAPSGPVATAFLAIPAQLQVFDYVPRGANGLPTKPYPFLAFGPSQSVRGEDQDCDMETEAYKDVEVWDDAVKRGSMGVQALADAIAAAAGGVLTIAGWTCTAGQVQTIRSLPIADGVARSIVTLRYTLDPA